MTNYPILNANDDWYYDSSVPGNVTGTETILGARINNLDPVVTMTAYGDIDTSAIPDDVTINDGSLWVYVNSYSVTGRGITKKFFALVEGNSLGELTHTTNGWYEFPLTTAAKNAINKTGKTQIQIGVQDPGGTNSRLVEIRAYEYTGDYEMYLSLDHSEPATGAPKKLSLAPQVIRFDSDTNPLIRL